MQYLLLSLILFGQSLVIIMQFSETINNMALSEARSISARDFSLNKTGNYHSLPHITQPILTKYRFPRQGADYIIEEQSGFWCTIFGDNNRPQGITLCKC